MVRSICLSSAGLLALVVVSCAPEPKTPRRADLDSWKDVPIIEILVKEGDAINAEDPLLTLESDKATMEVPAPAGGTVEKILVKVGDKVSEGTPILTFKGGEGAMTQPPSLVNQQEPPPQPQPVAVASPTPAQADRAATSADRGTGATTGAAAADFGNAPDPVTFCFVLGARFAEELERWRNRGAADTRRRWLDRATPVGTPVTVHVSADESKTVTFTGLEPDGALRLQTASGIQIIRAGDVEL